MPGARSDKCLQYLEDLQASHPSLANAIQQFAGVLQSSELPVSHLVNLKMDCNTVAALILLKELCGVQISIRGSCGIS